MAFLDETGVAKLWAKAKEFFALKYHTHSDYENKNVFGIVKIGTSRITADSQRDTLEIVDGANITITPDADNNKLTIKAVNTQNTAGASDTSSKIFLVGATAQDTSRTTYTHDTAFVGEDGCLYSNKQKVLTVADVDNVLSEESTNPIQGKTVKQKIAEIIYMLLGEDLETEVEIHYPDSDTNTKKSFLTTYSIIRDIEFALYTITQYALSLYDRLTHFGKTFTYSASSVSINGATLTTFTGIKPTLTGRYLIQIAITPAKAYNGRIRTLFNNMYAEVQGIGNSNVTHVITLTHKLNANTTYNLGVYLNTANTFNYSVTAVYLGAGT